MDTVFTITLGIQGFSLALSLSCTMLHTGIHSPGSAKHCQGKIHGVRVNCFCFLMLRLLGINWWAYLVQLVQRSSQVRTWLDLQWHKCLKCLPQWSSCLVGTHQTWPGYPNGTMPSKTCFHFSPALLGSIPIVSLVCFKNDVCPMVEWARKGIFYWFKIPINKVFIFNAT